MVLEGYIELYFQLNFISISFTDKLMSFKFGRLSCRVYNLQGNAVDAKDSRGQVFLYVAAKSEHSVMTKVLLVNGADVNARGAEYGNGKAAAQYRS
jgi:hypothetical protein